MKIAEGTCIPEQHIGDSIQNFPEENLSKKTSSTVLRNCELCSKLHSPSLKVDSSSHQVAKEKPTSMGNVSNSSSKKSEKRLLLSFLPFIFLQLNILYFKLMPLISFREQFLLKKFLLEIEGVVVLLVEGLNLLKCTTILLSKKFLQLSMELRNLCFTLDHAISKLRWIWVSFRKCSISSKGWFQILNYSGNQISFLSFPILFIISKGKIILLLISSQRIPLHQQWCFPISLPLICTLLNSLIFLNLGRRKM